ncbi:3-hydroxyacyl-CoA dehydrogenase NAD-binding domain-containing protein [Bdellovibrionota bacterium FG-1]
MASITKNSGGSENEAVIFSLADHSARLGAKIWTCTFDLPGEKVNKLSRRVMEQFAVLLDDLENRGKQGEMDALVLVSGKPGNFIAGADIELIQATRSAEDAENLSRMGQKLMDRWEDLPFPTVAAIQGAALGGGCEFSLASSVLIMSNDPATRIGLPEVMLGLIPGMGGCVRLPRKIGLVGALDLILTGKTLTAERAVKAGLAEAFLPKEDFQESALRWTKTNLKALKEGERLAKEPKLGGMGGTLGTFMEKTPMGRGVILKKAREGVLSKTRGHYPAPLEAIAVLDDGHAAYGDRIRGAGRDQAMIREAKGFGRLATTEISKNLIRIFFMTEVVKKSKGLSSGATAEAHTVRVGGVLGAGVMGGGIAQLFADKDLPIRMKDLTQAALQTGLQSASKIFYKQMSRKKINKRQYLQKMNLIAPSLDFSGFRSTDIVVEAIVENMDIKKKALAEMEGYLRDQCIVATNTSSLSVTEMQKALRHPERFAGMHFFNPVNKMPLVEVIRGEQSSDEAVSTVFQLSKQLGKTPIVVKDAPGFLVNRLLAPYLNEATYLLAEGVPMDELDQVLLEFGMPMGPMELIDEVGVDVGAKVAHILHDAFGERMLPCPLNEKIVKAGRLGKKNNQGLYKYELEGKKINKVLDPAVYELLGVKPASKSVSSEEILERCLLPMINEASRCLQEGVVASAAEVDLGMIMGTGFPPFRGGLLRYADSLGARTIVDRLRKYERKFGARYTPAPVLLERAERNQLFY